ncbi:hypothetical protein HK096_007568, partial [Nowakowskiella sp. JEL0078]
MESRLALASALIARNLSASLRISQSSLALNKVTSKKSIFQNQQLLLNVAITESIPSFNSLNSLKLKFPEPFYFSDPGGQNNYFLVLSAVVLAGTLATAYVSVNKIDKSAIQTPLLGFETVLTDDISIVDASSIKTFNFGYGSALSDSSTQNLSWLFSVSQFSFAVSRRMLFYNSEFLPNPTGSSYILNYSDLHKEIWQC